MKTVIEMAREAGFVNEFEECAAMVWVQDTEITEIIERFAELVRADEREACAKVCESRQTPGTGSVAILNGAVDAIRARNLK